MNIQYDSNFPVTAEAVKEIEGNEIVFNFLGHWPSFTDMEVLSLRLDRMDRNPSIYSDLTAEFYIYDLSKSPSDKDRKQAFLEILFSGLRDLKVEGWTHQNPLQGLSITIKDGNYFSVYWGGGLGHDASFCCDSIRVIRLRDRNPFLEVQDW
ncbi:Imm50 family immunity protein [Ruficoccus sp. ZRK36]|uniref:Imm50 family immunity protein n=1 Tax=Ruficoccus sp. ZRK36 TaxID=2866311 RepID=UPI001C733E1A|nr:Imm50 family immunity protein [Ruficoccus sp. ZRK36]QYY35120.1 hypothetical protein K0V07_12530 [Ruficoccus sp. ZRK36]